MPADATGRRIARARLEEAEWRILEARVAVCDAHATNVHSPECAMLAEVQIAIVRARKRLEEEAP